MAAVSGEFRPDAVIGLVNGIFETEGNVIPFLDRLFDSGIDVMVTGKAIMARAATREFLDQGRPVIRPLNLPGSAPGCGVLTRTIGGVSMRLVVLDLDDADALVTDGISALNTWLAAETDTSPLFLVLFGGNLDDKKALLWGLSRQPRRILAIGGGMGIPATLPLTWPNGSFVQDVGRIEQEWALNGLSPECWWARTRKYQPQKPEPPNQEPEFRGILLELGPDLAVTRSIPIHTSNGNLKYKQEREVG